MEEIAYKLRLFDFYIEKDHNLELSKDEARSFARKVANNAIKDGMYIDEETLLHIEVQINEGIDDYTSIIDESNNNEKRKFLSIVDNMTKYIPDDCLETTLKSCPKAAKWTCSVAESPVESTPVKKKARPNIFDTPPPLTRDEAKKAIEKALLDLEEIAYKSALYTHYVQLSNRDDLSESIDRAKGIAKMKAKVAIEDGMEMNEETLKHVEGLIKKSMQELTSSINNGSDAHNRLFFALRF